ncbi:MAG: segregation/condensation protein A [Pirellula sp.]|jgi:segregation and condensation protein A|nr:segregation/condensation protein A [Pirellula sp.]
MSEAKVVAFDVDLPSYHGPLDLLLYLIRRDELEIEDIALSRITRQYIEFLDVLKELDLENISEFIEIVSLLIEMKADRILPQSADNSDTSNETHGDSHSHLIERLIQYKRYRDIACVLDEQSRLWQLHVRRLAPNPVRRRNASEDAPIARIEIWDLVSAFGRILKARQTAPAEAIRYDDTPIQVYMQSIHARVTAQDRIELQELFQPGMHKSALVGLFLATLEMTRYHGLVAEQEASDGALWLRKGTDFPNVFPVDDQKPSADPPVEEALDRSNLPVRPR